MDHLLLSLVGKPKLNPPKVLTVTAENFSFVEDQARFMKATIAIPNVKKLPFDADGDKIFIQIGPMHSEVKAQLLKANWTIKQFDGNFDLAAVKDSLASHKSRCLVYFNDVSKVILLSSDRGKRFLKLVDEWKRCHGHFVLLFFQNTLSQTDETFIKLECISDAFIRTRALKDGYLKAMWWQTVPERRTLIDSMIETMYCTCKIGKFYWSSDLLCFYERQKVAKNYDPDKDTCLPGNDSSKSDSDDEDTKDDANALDNELSRRMGESGLLNEDNDFSLASNLPYTRAQNPERSRIFYYPDKDDDIDEDDPDNDLNL